MIPQQYTGPRTINPWSAHPAEPPPTPPGPTIGVVQTPAGPMAVSRPNSHPAWYSGESHPDAPTLDHIPAADGSRAFYEIRENAVIGPDGQPHDQLIKHSFPSGIFAVGGILPAEQIIAVTDYPPEVLAYMGVNKKQFLASQNRVMPKRDTGAPNPNTATTTEAAHEYDQKNNASAYEGRSAKGGLGFSFNHRLLPNQDGGPVNATNFLGSGYLIQQAMDSGMTSEEATNYANSYAVPSAVPDPSMPGSGYRGPHQGEPGARLYYEQFRNKFLAKGYGAPQYTSEDTAGFMFMDPAQLVKIQLAMIQAKVEGADSIVVGSYQGTEEAYKNALEQADLVGLPLDAFLDRSTNIARLSNRIDNQGGLSPTASKAPFDPTHVSTSMQLSTTAAAKTDLVTAMAEMLGRAPTDAEVATFKSTLNAEERANPQVTTTTSTRSGDQSSVTTGGDVDYTTLAQQAAKAGNRKEYRQYKELGYYNIIASMMGQ